MDLILSFILVAIVLYLLDNYFLNYWKRCGIKHIDGIFLLGNIKNVLLQKEASATFFKKIYDSTKSEPIIGIYLSYRPELVVNDPKLVKDILIKDFTAFHDRGVYVNVKHDILSGNLFTIEGQKWRDLRVKLSPTFTSGKLKGMFPIISECASTLENFIGKQIESGQDIMDARDLSARLTTNIIASVAFGVEVDCINEADHLFRRMGRKVFEQTFKNGIRNLRFLFFPKSKIFKNLKQMDEDVEEFFVNLVRETIDYREKNNVKRNDFMQLIIQLKNEGYKSVDIQNEKIDDDNFEYFKDKKIGGNQKITFEEACAQAFVFYVAGFETSSTATSFCLFELAKHQDIQRKLQDEIDEFLMTSPGKHEMSYETINSMKYLDACVDEALRKYPPVPILNRETSRDYIFSGTKTTIEKGTSIVIPIYGMHMDPDFYPNPNEFIPERFLNKKPNEDALTYLPFGDGPRNCIGMRLGKLNTKIGLVAILSKYSVEVTKDLPTEIDFDPKLFVLTPTVKLNFKFSQRNF